MLGVGGCGGRPQTKVLGGGPKAAGHLGTRSPNSGGQCGAEIRMPQTVGVWTCACEHPQDYSGTRRRTLTFDFCLSTSIPVLTTSTYVVSWPQGDQFLGGDLWHTGPWPSSPMAFASVLYPGRCLASQPLHLVSKQFRREYSGKQKNIFWCGPLALYIGAKAPAPQKINPQLSLLHPR